MPTSTVVIALVDPFSPRREFRWSEYEPAAVRGLPADADSIGPRHRYSRDCHRRPNVWVKRDFFPNAEDCLWAKFFGFSATAGRETPERKTFCASARWKKTAVGTKRKLASIECDNPNAEEIVDNDEAGNSVVVVVAVAAVVVVVVGYVFWG